MTRAFPDMVEGFIFHCSYSYRPRIRELLGHYKLDAPFCMDRIRDKKMVMAFDLEHLLICFNFE